MQLNTVREVYFFSWALWWCVSSPSLFFAFGGFLAQNKPKPKCLGACKPRPFFGFHNYSRLWQIWSMEDLLKFYYGLLYWGSLSSSFCDENTWLNYVAFHVLWLCFLYSKEEIVHKSHTFAESFHYFAFYSPIQFVCINFFALYWPWLSHFLEPLLSFSSKGFPFVQPFLSKIGWSEKDHLSADFSIYGGKILFSSHLKWLNLLIAEDWLAILFPPLLWQVSEHFLVPKLHLELKW